MPRPVTPPEPDTRRWVATIHPDAPPKPVVGAPCNGCGLCCLAEPCPVGVLVSRKRRGTCAALTWVDAAVATRDARTRLPGAYRCGLIECPEQQLPAWLHRLSPALCRALAKVLRRAARRFISAGSGCDADLKVEPAD